MGRPMLFLLCLGCLNAVAQAQIDLCSEDPCGAYAVCEPDGPFGYTCKCITGYTGDPDVECEDIDECDDPDIAATCDENAACVNSPGSYSCVCNDGYEGQGTECVDINECTDDEACPSNSECVNTEGSYTCVCDEGYRYIKRRNKCKDINECRKGTDTCHDNASCTNTAGSYTCTCNLGYTGNGFTCTMGPPPPPFP